MTYRDILDIFLVKNAPSKWEMIKTFLHVIKTVWDLMDRARFYGVLAGLFEERKDSPALDREIPADAAKGVSMVQIMLESAKSPAAFRTALTKGIKENWGLFPVDDLAERELVKLADRYLPERPPEPVVGDGCVSVPPDNLAVMSVLVLKVGKWAGHILYGTYRFRGPNYVFMVQPGTLTPIKVAMIPVNESVYRMTQDPDTGLVWIAGEGDGEILNMNMEVFEPGKTPAAVNLITKLKPGKHSGAFYADGRIWVGGGEVREPNGGGMYFGERLYAKSHVRIQYEGKSVPVDYVMGQTGKDYDTAAHIVRGSGSWKWGKHTFKGKRAFDAVVSPDAIGGHKDAFMIVCGSKNPGTSKEHAAAFMRPGGSMYTIWESGSWEYSSCCCRIGSDYYIGLNKPWDYSGEGAAFARVWPKERQKVFPALPHGQVRAMDATPNGRLVLGTKNHRNNGGVFVFNV